MPRGTPRRPRMEAGGGGTAEHRAIPSPFAAPMLMSALSQGSRSSVLQRRCATHSLCPPSP